VFCEPADFSAGSWHQLAPRESRVGPSRPIFWENTLEPEHLAGKRLVLYKTSIRVPVRSTGTASTGTGRYCAAQAKKGYAPEKKGYAPALTGDAQVLNGYAQAFFLMVRVRAILGLKKINIKNRQ